MIAMGAAKEVVRAIIAVVIAVLMFNFWTGVRTNDPEYYKYAAALLVGVLTFAILHFIGKEN